MIHELKTWPEFFDAVDSGEKTFEIRLNDRGFKVGDILFLREYHPETNQYTTRHCWRKVTYITSFGMTDGKIVMAIKPADGFKH